MLPQTGKMQFSVADLEMFPPPSRRTWPGQPVPLFSLPLTGRLADSQFVTSSNHIPIRSESLVVIELGPLLEFVIDESVLLAECRRVLVPGGTLTGLVPNATGFGSLDPINAVRYARDMFGGGPSLPELAESGWRQHFGAGELRTILEGAGFTDIDIAGSGTIGPELRVAHRLLVRWLTGSAQSLEPPILENPAPHRLTRNNPLGARLIFSARKG